MEHVDKKENVSSENIGCFIVFILAIIGIVAFTAYVIYDNNRMRNQVCSISWNGGTCEGNYNSRSHDHNEIKCTDGRIVYNVEHVVIMKCHTR